MDASTKIYAYRVDCVHNDTLKMAGGLGRTGGEAQQENQDDNVDGEQQEEDQAKVKKKFRVSRGEKCFFFLAFFSYISCLVFFFCFQ